MPNRVIGKVFRFCKRYLDQCRQAVADSVNYAQLNSLEQPFEIHRSVEFRNPHQIRIESSCCIKARTIIDGRSTLRKFGISLGPDTYLKEQCYLDAYGGFIEVEGHCAFAQGTFIHGGGGVTIGANVILGPNCYIVASNHRFGSREYPIMLQGDRRIGIRIGQNVWIGGNVTVLDGVVIGNNCVIGAGTVVTNNVASNTLVFDRRQREERGICFDDQGY